jgi:subtilase family serine protease
MKTGTRLWWTILCAVLCASGGQRLWAQKTPVPSRVIEQVDEARKVQIQGNVHPLARAEFDRGAAAQSQPMTRMLLLLERSTEQESALRQLLDAQQTKSSANYHTWLTPEQFGKQFGPSDADLQTVTEWLTKQGFQVAKVSAGRTTIEFNGTVAQVENAFQTQIHHFVVDGREHMANISDPSIPLALAPVVKGVVALNNFPKHSMMHRVGSFERDLATGQVKPLFTYTDLNGTFYGVGPADFATIYSIPSTIAGAAPGAGQSIAVAGQSNINIQDVRDFRSMFGLPAKDPQIILNGPDPGLVPGDEGESDLDVEWAGAVAPAAQILFVVSQTTDSNPAQVSQGVDLSALYIIDNNLAPVMSESYGTCESALGTSGNQFYSLLWQQAAAQGITVVVSTGDNGSAGCDPTSNPNAATGGLAVSGFASTPYNVAVGGTDFNQFNIETQYWNSTNAPSTQLSAKGYISEVTWDDSLCAANFPNPCTTVDSSTGDISAGSGGPSAVYGKPPYQVGMSAADSARDIPDISLFSSNGFNNSFYIVCQSDANPNNAPCDLSTSASSGSHNFQGVGGTSGATPPFAAIIALVNQSQATAQNPHPRQGNANYVLYALAKKEDYTKCNSSSFTNPANPAPASCVFYDITSGNNSVACVSGSSASCKVEGSATFGILVDASGKPAYTAVPGYDLATGLGSVNVGNLLTLWGSAGLTPTTTALSSASASSVTSGQNFSVKVAVTPASVTGDVALTALASDQTTILGGVGPFTLSGGSVTASTKLLPANTAFIVGKYSGDATHAASSSTPPLALTVNGANQSSKTTLSFVTYGANNNPTLSTSAQNIQYGAAYILQIAVTNSGGTPCTNGGTLTTPGTPCPTGKITLTDGGNALNDWPTAGTPNATNVASLNNQGIAEDRPVQLAVGSHSIAAAYAGDPNYQASTSNTLSVNVAKATTTTTASNNAVGSIVSGATVTLTAVVSTNSSGVGPTASVQFANGSANLGTAATCTPTSGAQNATNGTAFCTATLTTAISVLYPMPQNRPKPPVVPIILLALSIVAYLALMRWMPENRKRAYAYAGLLVFGLLAVGIAGCGGGSGGGNNTGGKTVTVNANYSGDANYTSSSGQTQIVVQ